MSNKKYSTAVNGAGIRLHDFKQVASLAQQGLSDAEIKSRVFEENLFQLKSSSTKRSFPYVLERVRILDDTLLEWVLEATVDVVKVIIFYTILKTDLLFYEFMVEVIYEKLISNNYIYEKKDLNLFLSSKAEQDENVNSWSDSTIKRLKSSYNKLLLEMGYLDNLKSTRLNRIYVDQQVKEHLIKIGDEKYIKIIEG